MTSRKLVILCAAFMFSTIGLGAGAKSEKYNIAITQIVEHPSLDAVRQGVIDFLNENGYKNRVTIDYSNAQGNMVTNTQIAQKIMGKRPHAIVAIGTPAAQAVINKNNSIPVLFSPISDPIAAKLAKDWSMPGGIATGTSDRSPIKEQLELIKTIVPKAESVAIMYNPGEANSVSLVEQFKKACQELAIKPMEGPVQNTAMVYSTASSLKADAIYVPTDNTVVSAIEAVIKAGITTKTPVFTAESNSVEKGAIATLAVNYYDLGKMTGEMLIRILEKNEHPSKMPVLYQKEFELHINQKNAEKMGVTFPESVLNKAIKH